MKQLLIIFMIAALFSWAGGQHGSIWLGLPLLAWVALWIFALQWLAFIPAYLAQTEVFYDLTGSLTYLSAVALALWGSTAADPRSLLLALLISIWAARLGTFLFARIHQDGGDSRFDKIKPSAMRFFGTWNLQGLWVLMTAGCALSAITSQTRSDLSPIDLVGIALWLLGFGIEVVADRQKRRFRQQFGHSQFINTGLWARSRHPNYFGEIVLWLGIALLALPALQGWQYLTLVSPLFVIVLLTRISGIPLLERKSDKRWGDNPDYQTYKANTPVLIPRL